MCNTTSDDTLAHSVARSWKQETFDRNRPRYSSFSREDFPYYWWMKCFLLLFQSSATKVDQIVENERDDDSE